MKDWLFELQQNTSVLHAQPFRDILFSVNYRPSCTYNERPQWPTATQQTSAQTKHSGQPQATNQQNHKANKYIAIVQGHPNKTHG
jgi:protein involved in temperature-dependent protein secretion